VEGDAAVRVEDAPAMRLYGDLYGDLYGQRDSDCRVPATLPRFWL
jgi:hypothetical protein